jgi:uncharacterized protein (DUF58 family)
VRETVPPLAQEDMGLFPCPLFLATGFSLDYAMERNHTIRLQLRAPYLRLLVGLLFLLQLLIPFKGWMILLVGVGGAWLVSYLWAHSLARGLELTREMRYGWAQVGDQLQERLTLTNRSRVPAPWVAVVDHSTLPGYQASRALGLGERAQMHWFEQLLCSRRGLYTLGPTSLQSSDPFVFYSADVDYLNSFVMMVMPPIVHLPTIDVAPGGRVGEGRRQDKALEHAVSASSVREYRSGDSLRWIHWRTSARRDEPFVRTFDHTPSSNWWIVLDLDRRVQAGEGEKATEEHGVILAASLAHRGLQGGKAVGLVAHGQELVWLPPRLGADQRWEILRALALAEPGRCSLSELLAHTGPALGPRGSLVIISPDADGHWLESLVPLMRRGLVPTVLLLDPASFSGEGRAGGVLASLVAMEVTHYLITPDLLDRPDARPGQVGQWHRTPQGRWEPSFHPRELAWRPLVRAST